MAPHVGFEPLHVFVEPRPAVRNLVASRPWLPDAAHAIEQRITERVLRFENLNREGERSEAVCGRREARADGALESLDEREQDVFFFAEMAVERGSKESEKLGEASHVGARTRACGTPLTQQFPNRGKLGAQVGVMRVPDVLHQLGKGRDRRFDRHPVNREVARHARAMGPLLLRIGRLFRAEYLVVNAIKFTPPGGRIIVRLCQTGSAIELSVSDTGVGISAEFLPLVFEPFSQGASDMMKHDGLGLGLAIVKNLVHAHGAKIAVASPGLGGGTTFTVSFPLGHVSVLPATSEVGRQVPIADPR